MCDLFNRAGKKITNKTTENEKGKLGYMELKPCPRCGGAGGSDKWKFTGWTCYRCNGSGNDGYMFVRLYTADELSKLNARAEKAKAKKEAKQAAEIEARREGFLAQYKGFMEKAEKYVEKSGVINDIVTQAKRRFLLSEKQVEYAEKIIAEIDAKEAKLAARGEAPGGVQVITGVVTGTNIVPGFYGKTQLKMFVEIENGATVYGTAPAKLLEICHKAGNSIKGQRVKFKALFTKTDDIHFSWFKSPKKVELIEGV
jgi:hypothetical protein